MTDEWPQILFQFVSHCPLVVAGSQNVTEASYPAQVEKHQKTEGSRAGHGEH